MPTNVEWSDLQYLLEVARGGSKSRAARALGVAQPTVGRRLAALEHSLKAKLLIAAPDGQRLTEAGQRIVACAQDMERAALAAEVGAKGASAIAGRVQITASDWVVDRILAPRIGALAQRYPGLELDVVADAQHFNLSRREADVALRPSRFSHAAVVQRAVAVTSFGLYASEDYLRSRGEPDFDSGCRGHALVELVAMPRRTPEAEWLAALCPRARVSGRANGRLALARMISGGMGLGCLPRLVGDGYAGLRRILTPLREPERQLWLGAHREMHSIPRVRAAWDFLVELLGQSRGALHPR